MGSYGWWYVCKCVGNSGSLLPVNPATQEKDIATAVWLFFKDVKAKQGSKYLFAVRRVTSRQDG